MRDADDVAGLFKVFGGDPAQYVKGDAARDALQAGAGRWQLLSVIEGEMGTAVHTMAVAPAQDARESLSWADMDDVREPQPVSAAAAAVGGASESAVVEAPTATAEYRAADVGVPVDSASVPPRSAAIPSRMPAADVAVPLSPQDQDADGGDAAAETANGAGSKAQADGDCSLSDLFGRLARVPPDAPVDPLKKLRFS